LAIGLSKLQIPYGSKLIDVDIVGKQLEHKSSIDENKTKPKDLDVERIRHALQNPIGTKKLREIIDRKRDAKIVIVVDDHTITKAGYPARCLRYAHSAK
jgi:nickel-dependent lactate racemase